MPTKVDRLVKQIIASNPTYDDAKAYATAWSVYCRYVKPNSPSCHRLATEYLTREKRSARR